MVTWWRWQVSKNRFDKRRHKTKLRWSEKSVMSTEDKTKESKDTLGTEAVPFQLVVMAKKSYRECQWVSTQRASWLHVLFLREKILSAKPADDARVVPNITSIRLWGGFSSFSTQHLLFACNLCDDSIWSCALSLGFLHLPQFPPCANTDTQVSQISLPLTTCFCTWKTAGWWLLEISPHCRGAASHTSETARGAQRLDYNAHLFLHSFRAQNNACIRSFKHAPLFMRTARSSHEAHCVTY